LLAQCTFLLRVGLTERLRIQGHGMWLSRRFSKGVQTSDALSFGLGLGSTRRPAGLERVELRRFARRCFGRSRFDLRLGGRRVGRGSRRSA
jgi:hypothetical protein